MDFSIFVYTFILVFLNNIIPIIGAPTWVILSFIAYSFPIPSLPILICVALLAAVSGRFLLMKFSEEIIRNKFLAGKYKKNMDRLKFHLGKKPLFTSLVFLLDAITPLPSDQLFIAYGLTGLKARYALIPFAIGRAVTYTTVVYAASKIASNIESISQMSFSTTFILITILMFLLLYIFVKIDWDSLIVKRKFRLIK